MKIFKQKILVSVLLATVMLVSGFFVSLQYGNNYKISAAPVAASGQYAHGISVAYNGDVYTQRGLTWITPLSVTSCAVDYVQAKPGLTLATFDNDWSSSSPVVLNIVLLVWFTAMMLGVLPYIVFRVSSVKKG